MKTPRRKENERLLIKTWTDESNEIKQFEDSIRTFWKAVIIGGFLGISLLSCSLAHADTIKVKSVFVAGFSLDKWADSIKITEGNYLYGIKSIKPKNALEARKICKNTVRNNYKRFIAKGGNSSDLKGYINFLADRYCPKSADPQGNINWKANMIKLMR